MGSDKRVQQQASSLDGVQRNLTFDMRRGRWRAAGFGLQRVCHDPHVAYVRSVEGLGASGRRMPMLVQHVRTPLLVALTVGELDGDKAVTLIKPPCTGVGLKRVQTNG